VYLRLTAICIALAGLAACQSKPASGTGTSSGKPGDASSATPDADFTKATGQQAYVALCAPCHAANLKGYAADHAPSLVNPTFLESATDDFLKKSITVGRPGTSMAPYGRALGGPLDDAAVDRLVGYIRQNGPAAKPLALVPPGGDATKGKVLYDAGCKSCHGDTRTRGEAIHLANPTFLATATDPFIRHAIVFGRPETKMAAFAGALTDPQITDVIAYLRSFATGAAPVGTLPPPTGKEPLVINPKGADPQWKLRQDRFVAVDDVAAALKKGQRMVIIDARPPSDWMRAHIEGAVSIPYHELKRLSELPKDVWAIAYCACPHHLSGIVVDELIKRGHKRALVLDEGVNAWHKRGYPMTTAPGVQPPADEPNMQQGHEGHNHGHEGHGH
jgi:mono/diheme cytochrome c family protein/rhodanese-related sulfurtransferase